MRSKNQVPVQVILPESQMSENHSSPRTGFEEALQSSIEASLRTNGTAPSLHIFSLLYHQSKPQRTGDATGSSSSLFQSSLNQTDNGDAIVDVKPDISDLNREIAMQSRPAEDPGSVGEPSEASRNAHSAHSSLSPKDSQNEAPGNFSMSSRGPPPLLMPNTFTQPSAVTSNNSEPSAMRNSSNRQMMPRLSSILPGNIQQLEQLQKAQEQVKQLQQLQKWRLLHQHQARAAVASSLSQIPRLPFFNPLIPSSGLNRNAFPKHVSSINGVPESITSVSQPSPGSPMFRKGYCKGGKDIRLSTLQQDGSLISYPVEYSLVALSISPSVPQVVKPSGGYQPPDIPAEGMVVVAINSICLSPQQNDSMRPVLAQCIGCGDATLVTFASLASHVNLRSTAPSNVNQSEISLLQRHARHFVLRETSPPHACVRGAIIPWPIADATQPTTSSTGRSSMQTPRTPQLLKSGTSFVIPSRNDLQIEKQELLRPPLSTHTSLSGVSHPHLEAAMPSQSDTEFLQSCITANGVPEFKFRMDWSPISSDNSDHVTSQNLTSSENARSLAWNPTVKLPECFPEFVGLPLILICWEWQLLQSNINNIHITRSFAKCFQEVFSSENNSSAIPLSKEMCFFIVTQYLVSLGVHEFPIPSILSSWFTRAQKLLDSMHQVLSDGNSFVNLAKVMLTNARDRIGLVTSQKSQAHAINECICKLRQGGPTCHIIAHVNGNSVLDLSLLLTGKTSRLAREYLLSDDEESKLIDRLCTTEVFHQIDQKLTAIFGHAGTFEGSSRGVDHGTGHLKMSAPPPVDTLRQFFPSTSNVPISYGRTEIRISQDSTSTLIDNQLSEIDNIASKRSSDEETIANRLCDELFSHASSIFINSSTELALSHFSSIQCYFFLPPSIVGVAEAVTDITTSKLIPEMASLSTILESADARDLVITMEVSSNERVGALSERITQDSSTLFLLFCTDSHVHCDKTSLGAEWLMKLTQHQNVFVVYSTYIPQALLNRNTSIRKEHVVLCETDLQSSDNHCPPSVSSDMNLESRNTKLSESLPSIPSLMIKAHLVLSDYISCIKMYMSSLHKTNYSEETDMEMLRHSSSTITYSSVRNLLSTRRGTSILLRIPHEAIAEKIADDLIDMREKMRLQNMFEVMLYSSNQKPYLSDHFLKVIKRFKKKSENWQPETLSEIDCIPLVLIYTGKTVITQNLPCNLSHVDLRLLGMSSSVLTQSALQSEMSLVRSGSRFVLEKSTKQYDELEVKRSKSIDSDDGALCMDTFSDESLDQEDHRLKWKSLDQKTPEHQLAVEKDESCVSSRKRKRDQADEAPEQVVIRRQLTVIVCEDLYPFAMAYLKQSEKFRDLAPHPLTQWCHGRPTSNIEESPVYFRKWTQPLQDHHDYKKNGIGKEASHNHEERSILLVTSTAVRVAYGCCLFVKRLNRTLKNLLQVEAYDYISSAIVKPSYPLLNDNAPLQWPVYTTILDMDYDTSIGCGTAVNASRITNGVKPIDLKTDMESPPTKSLCMIGRYPAHNIEHRQCNSCGRYESSIQATTHLFVLPNGGTDDGFGIDHERVLTLKFVIPSSEKHCFIFDCDDEGGNNIEAIMLTRKDETGIKTPVFSLGIHGAHNGLYNLDHMLRRSLRNHRDEISNDSKRPVHILVVKHKDLDEYLSTWPNKILMVLPEDFDDLATGAMKYAVQLAMSHSLTVLRGENRLQSGFSSNEVWPFALLLDDSVFMWTSTFRMPSPSVSENNAPGKWQSVSLLEILERIESLPCVERYAAIGFRNWSSQMHEPCSEESFTGDLVSSRFSKCLLSSSYVINAGSTKDEMFDDTKFLHEDIDWCIRIAAADMVLLRFNDVAFASKVLPVSEPQSSAISCINPEAFINLADAKYNPIQKHPHQLLETFLCHLGHHVFPCAKGNAKHPILVIDRYISLGTKVYVEYACSKPGALPWAVDTEKTYSGLLLHCQSSEITLSFLQQFKFTEGATVCIVGGDRSSLRQTVVNLHLENNWHFRLTDEYQTANNPSYRKPLFYLTGVSRSSR